MEDYLKKDTLENKEAIWNQIKVIYNNIIFLFDNIQKCFEAFLNPNFKESVEEIFYEFLKYVHHFLIYSLTVIYKFLVFKYKMLLKHAAGFSY
jgi:hypothetical protein